MATRDSIPGLAARLKAVRESAALSQSEAARRSGVQRINLLRYESDKKTPTLRALYLLAKAYGLATVCDLLPPLAEVIGPPAAE